MGHKITPYSNRLSLEKNWISKWFGGKKYANFIKLDDCIRKYIFERFKGASVENVFIERNGEETTITIKTSRPGMIIGRSGETTENLQKELKKMTENKIKIEITDVKKPDISPRLIADSVAYQIEKRVAFRKAMAIALDKAKEKDIKGARISISGRLGGLEIARRETLSFGSLPLSTLRKKIGFSYTKAITKFGVIGVKVWIHK